MNTIIRYFKQKINTLGGYLERRDIAIIIVLISLAVTSFSIGYYAGTHRNVPVITMRDNSCIPPVTEASIKEGERLAQGDNTIVASKSGTRYYYVWCSGASRIAAKNKVYFKSEQEAEKKGYTKASGCE